MGTNLILNVKCSNQHLLNYIYDLINKKESISGLEISLYKETPKPTKSSNQNNKPIIKDNKSVYDGGWVDMEDKQAVQKMFDSFII